MTPHPAQRRYLAEDLVRQRVASDGRRFAAPQRAGEVDPNPHQIEAVVFALARFRVRISRIVSASSAAS
jgi:hypothetical protein